MARGLLLQGFERVVGMELYDGEGGKLADRGETSAEQRMVLITKEACFLFKRVVGMVV